MSIIHDALKKVQYRLDKKHGPAPTAGASAPPIRPTEDKSSAVYSPSSAKVSSNKMIVILMYAILISMGIILILVFKLTAQNPAPTVTASTVPVSATVQQTRPAVMPQHSPIPTTPAPVAALSRDPSVLELGGTMLKGNQRVALINDDIYEVGNSIEGKKITEILLAEVKLVDEKTGEVSTLKVKSRR